MDYNNETNNNTNKSNLSQTAASSLQFTLVKLPIQEIIRQDYHVTLTQEEELPFLVSQGNSLLFDQIARLREQESSHITELILVSARKSPSTASALKHILAEGFSYGGVRYLRFGKSASQAKEGITAFAAEPIFQELYRITQLDLEVKECVISKYEAQRCLVFSTCTLIPDYVPRIVIIGEYEKILKEQYIRYVRNVPRTITDSETGEAKNVMVKEVAEGFRDIPLSPFDGCGCHELEFSQTARKALGLDYLPVGTQVRLPFLKGFSVYVPFRAIFREMGVTEITDVYGSRHKIEDIDCIWNISMFKGHGMFQKQYGSQAWKQYMTVLKKYEFKLGISKYSHHVKDFPRKSRMNFQYLQCLDLWNENYRKHFEDKSPYQILAPENEGKIIHLAKYTTELFEKIIKGDPLYTCMFLGMNSKNQKNYNQYMEALRINRRMLQDKALQNFLYRSLKKQITEAKLGKIYADGFYHTIVGDMIGYLEYAAGREPKGCLKAQEFYAPALPSGDVLSFRSPLVDSSEVNQVRLVSNEIVCTWFSHFEEQDVAMINMYDLSLPQQGGADCDGDAIFLCPDSALAGSRISKPIIIDVEDKAAAGKKSYTKEHIIDYEIATRDSRIGEITNCATSIENKWPANEELSRIYSDMTSMLRIIQGKEIDSIKTGTRWHMNAGMRKHLKQLPWFLLYRYPKKLKTFESLHQKNKEISDSEDKLPLPGFFSPSPMNELCDYINTWEKKHLIWSQPAADNRDILLNHDYSLEDRRILRQVRHSINEYSSSLKLLLAKSQEEKTESDFDEIALMTKTWKEHLARTVSLPEEEELANYVIKVCYSHPSLSKQPAWSGYGDYILKNLRENSPQQAGYSIVEVPGPAAGKAEHCYEYLGKYYLFQETPKAPELL